MTVISLTCMVPIHRGCHVLSNSFKKDNWRWLPCQNYTTSLHERLHSVVGNRQCWWSSSINAQKNWQVVHCCHLVIR